MVLVRHSISSWVRAEIRTSARIVASSVLMCAVAATRIYASTDLPSNVRSTSPAMIDLVDEGARASATFRGLLSTIATSPDIVYLEFGYCSFGRLNGCLLPVSVSSDGRRYLRILIRRDHQRLSHDRLLALIAHELQHAIEVTAAPHATDVEAMFARVGYPLGAGLSGHETSAARRIGDRVLVELSARSNVRRSRGCGSAPRSVGTLN